MLYIDTSVLVAALTNESRTAEMQNWLASQRPEDLMISDWVMTEFSAALSIKVRTGHSRQRTGPKRLPCLDRWPRFPSTSSQSVASILLRQPGFRTNTRPGYALVMPCISRLRLIMATTWFPLIAASARRRSRPASAATFSESFAHCASGWMTFRPGHQPPRSNSASRGSADRP